MLTLPGYTVTGLFDEDARIRVYRAIDRHDGAPVILKIPHGEEPKQK